MKSHPAARRLGLVYEHIAIAARHRRVRAAWAPHLAASRAAVLEAAQHCTAFRRALVIGAGDCLDVPVEELAAQFDEVVLADVAVGFTARRWARKLAPRVRCVAWDATGALASVAAARASLDRKATEKLFADADPGPPPGGEPDFLVSANCISQLGLVPGHALPAADRDDALPERCAVTAARRHLAWLALRPAATVRVVLADAARLDVSPEGKELKRENLHQRFGLRAPDRRWRWDLAPIPEWDSKFHRVHEVGAWVSGGNTERAR